METAEFEEKQYEWALLNELMTGSPHAYPSGQVLEALVGYDLALHPGRSKIWGLLGAGFPSGVVLTAGLWAGAPKAPEDHKLPGNIVSLILQVKRPQLLDHWRAGQDHYWRGPYFRFHVTPSQQDQLEALESNTRGTALVRYAAPAFLSLQDLEERQLNATVSNGSTFVAPEVLVGHRLWSYAGPGTVGYANPEGSESWGDTWQTLLGRAAEQAEPRTLDEHVIELAEMAGLEISGTKWINLVSGQRDFGPDRRPALAAWAAFAEAVAAAQAEWIVLGFADPPELGRAGRGRHDR